MLPLYLRSDKNGFIVFQNNLLFVTFFRFRLLKYPNYVLHITDKQKLRVDCKQMYFQESNFSEIYFSVMGDPLLP